MNDPRCQMGDSPQCRNQAAGLFIVGDKCWPICEDDWLSLREQMHWETALLEDPLAACMFGNMGWEPFNPGPVRAAIDRRLIALGQGAFG